VNFLSLLILAGVLPVKSSHVPLPSPEQHIIELRTRSIDTRDATALWQVFTERTLPRRFIVHFNYPITQVDRNNLESNDLKIEGYLSHNAFLVYGVPDLAAQMFSKGLIDYYGAYLPEDKIDPALLERQDITEMEVMLFPGVRLGEAVDFFEALGARIVRTNENQYNAKLQVRMDAGLVLDAAALDGVRWIEPYCEVELDNNNCQWVLQTWKHDNRRVWDAGLFGEGVIGATSDSGIRTDHVMFRDSTIQISGWGDYPEHRKIVAYQPISLMAGFGDEAAARYHGTHTAGTVCGDDSYWGQNSPFDGMAPQARHYFVDMQGSFWILPSDYRDLYAMPQEGNQAGGAKFISNSWSSGFGYNSHAWETDDFMWRHPGFLVIGTAGNNDPQIGAPKTAKSILTVGAVHNAGAAIIPADFSNPGPAPDGRIKPTVVAPGVDVWSANGAGGNTYRQMSGTSMACPAIAGVTALVVEYMRKGFYPTGAANPSDSVEPSAALLKALLVASCDADFSSHPIPSAKIGWGRVDLDSALYFAGDVRKLYLYDDTAGLQTGDQVGFEMGIESNEYPLRVVLVWTDPPPEMGAAKQLVNNLDLQVYDPSGNLYCGNHFKDNYSEKSSNPDALNVVEMVRIKRPSPGAWSVRLKANNVPQGPQPYALVVTGDIQYHDVDLVACGMWIDDKDAYNPNGGLDPGETVAFHPEVANQGGYDASDVTGILSTDHEGVEILTERSDYSDILQGGISSGEGFGVHASSHLDPEEVITFFLELQANQGGYIRTLAYPVTIGLRVEEKPGESLFSLEVMRSPFGGHIGVRFSLPEPAPVRLEMFDNAGRRVRTLLDEHMFPAGFREYTFTAADDAGRKLPSGVYFVRLQTNQRHLVCKGLRLK
jgi:subtilisin family serine protease